MSTTRVWFRITIVAVSAAALWVVAVLLLPEDGWLRPGQVTGFGLVVVLGLIVTFLVLEARETETEDRRRRARRRKRREADDVP